MCHHSSHNPVQCVVPPYISDKLLDQASARKLPVIINDELRSSRFRNDRSFFGKLSETQRAVLSPVARALKTPAMKMQVFDMEHDTDLTKAKLVWDNGKAIGRQDADTKHVIAAGTATWDMYYQIFGRNSIDNLGLVLKHYIHFTR